MSVAAGPTGVGGPHTTAQHALDRLRAEIVSGALAPGQHIRQDTVAARLGVSIAPVREALRILEQEGQVRYLPRRGYTVTELNLADLTEIYALRQLIESQAARVAVAALDGDALVAIAAAADQCAQAAADNDIAAELAANRRFHLGLLGAAGQPHTLRIITQLWDSTEAYRGLYYAIGDERRTALEAHERILDALRRRDADDLIEQLDLHRQRALDVLGDALAARAGG